MPQPTGQRPNVIVFFTDQQRWDTSGLHGNPMGLMPNFDREALLGTHLTHRGAPRGDKGNNRRDDGAEAARRQQGGK